MKPFIKHDPKRHMTENTPVLGGIALRCMVEHVFDLTS